MLRNLEVPHKSSEIFSVILPIFKVSMNLAHIKCLAMLLGALCAVQTVCLSKQAGAFDSKASRESSFRLKAPVAHRLAQNSFAQFKEYILEQTRQDASRFKPNVLAQNEEKHDAIKKFVIE